MRSHYVNSVNFYIAVEITIKDQYIEMEN